MGLFGNAEVSPATHHVFAPHTQGADALARGGDEVRVARCGPVPFSSNASGLSCVDRHVAAVSGNYFIDLALAIDRAGHVYVVWSQLPFDTTGDAELFWASSKDDGDTWTAPKPISTPGLRTNVFPWIAAGDSGRLDLAWYGTSSVDPDSTAGCGGPGDVQGDWGVYFTQTLDGLSTAPDFTAPSLVSEHFVHRGGIASAPGGKFCGNGVLGDFLELRVGLQGEANIVYADSNNANGVYPGLNDPNGGQLAHPMFVRQNGGPGLYESQPLIQGEPPATNSVRDAGGDATFDAGGRVSRSLRNLDIRACSIAKRGRRLRITLKITDLRSLAPHARRETATLTSSGSCSGSAPRRPIHTAGRICSLTWSLRTAAARASGSAKARAQFSRRTPRASRIPASRVSKARTREPRPAGSGSVSR